MHGNYMFLVDLCDTVENTDPQDVFDSWEAEYIDIHGDENNWHSPISVHLGDKVYENKEDFVLTDKSSDPFLSAMKIAAYDLELFGVSGFSLPGTENPERDKIESMSADEIFNAIITDIPEKLSEAYNKAIGIGSSTEYERERYIRRIQSRGFEMFINSKISPFSPIISSPYTWRCYDLRSSYHLDFNYEESAVISVDIHT